MNGSGGLTDGHSTMRNHKYRQTIVWEKEKLIKRRTSHNVGSRVKEQRKREKVINVFLESQKKLCR